MKKYVLFFLICLMFAPQIYSQGRAFQIKDLYAVKYASTPHVSPDGSRIAYLLTTYDFENSESSTQIYLYDIDSDQITQITESAQSIERVSWHPQGESILIVQTDTVHNTSQAFQYNLSNDNQSQLPDFSTGTDNARFTPDGKYLIFTSRIFPEAGENSTQNAILQKSLEKGPIQAHLADDLFYRHWDFWKDGKRRHIFSLNLETENLVNLTQGQYEAPRFDLGGTDGYDISPDGKHIVYVSNPDPEPQSSTNGDLWMVPVTGGSPQNITSHNPAFDGHPKFSPNGRYIAYLKQSEPGYEADLFQLAIYDRKQKNHTVITPEYNNWISDFLWAPNSDKIYFSGPAEGYYPIYELTIQSQNIRLVQEKVYTRGFEISPDGSTLYILNSIIDQPGEIYSINIQRQSLVQLTEFNQELQSDVDFRPAESTWVMSNDGTRIHLFIIKPHGFDPDKKYPLILNVHGGPQGMYGNSFRGDYQVYPGAGYVVAFSNPRGSIGYGQEFTSEISGDWGGQVYKDLMAVTDYLETLPYVDTERMGAMGWSYGGYMMNWFQGHTDRFKALASMMGVYDLRSFYSSTEELWFPEWDLQGQPWNSDLYEKWSPSNYVENFQTPCLVITGKLDFRVPYSQSLMLFNDLQVMDVPSRLIVFENDGHWPNFLKSMPLYYNAHLEWFHEYLGGMPAPYNSREMWRNQILNWNQ